jgi:hypothetical protein
MFERLADRIPFKKIVTVLAIVFGLSLGLCGVTFAVSSGSGGGNFLISFGILELIGIGVSAAGLLLTFLLFVAVSIFSGPSEGTAQPKITPGVKDDTNSD